MCDMESLNLGAGDPDFHFADPSLNDHLVAGLRRLRQARHLCDVTLVVGERRIPGHRVVLAAISPYFQALFSPNMVEGKMEDIRLQDIDGEILELVINYVYCGEVTVKSTHVLRLLRLADFLDIGPIREACYAFFVELLNTENCLDIYNLACQFDAKKLKEKALEFLSDCLKMNSEQSLELYELAHNMGEKELKNKALDSLPLFLKSNPDVCLSLAQMGPDHPEVVQLALDHLPNYLQKHTDECLSIYQDAHDEGLNEVTEKVLDFLPHYLNSHVDQCVNIYLQAHKLGQRDLEQKAKEFILLDFWRVQETNAFYRIPVAEFLDLLKQQNLSFIQPGVVPLPQNQEQGLLTCVLDYVKHQPAKLQDYLLELLRVVNMNLVSSEALCRAEKDPLVHGSPSCLDFIRAAQALNSTLSDSSKKRVPRPHPRMCSAMKVCVSEQRADTAGSGSTATPIHDPASSFLESYVTGMKIWMRRMQTDTILSGLEVLYSGREPAAYGSVGHVGDTCREFHLAAGEAITWIAVRSSTFVTSLKFYTSLSNSIGPFGGDSGRLDIFKHPAPDPMHGYLAGVRAASLNGAAGGGGGLGAAGPGMGGGGGGAPAITGLQFYWLYADVGATWNRVVEGGRR